MTESKIEWTGRSDWNPIRGCTRVSPGCGGPGPHGGCYAEAIAGRFSDEGRAFHGYATRTPAGGRWTGKVELVEDRLTLPLRWKKPAMVFASSTSDIFHEGLADGDIDRIFAVMALTPQHTYQVLTKRSARMRAYMAKALGRIADAAIALRRSPVAVSKGLGPSSVVPLPDIRPGAAWWPLPNVWLGVSVEDQQRANERIPDLLTMPAAIRFLSCEPLLGPVDIDCPDVDWATLPTGNGLTPLLPEGDGRLLIDWVIAGGESGQRARPMHPAWPRALRDQCKRAGIPFFFKQWGEHLSEPAPDATWKDGSAVPADLEPVTFKRVGKKAAGRMLDGVQHDGMPA